MVNYKNIVIMSLILTLLTLIVCFYIFTRDKYTLTKCVPTKCVPTKCVPLETVPQGLVQYDTNICKSDMSTCIDPTNTNDECRLIKSLQKQSFFGYKVNILGTDPAVSNKNCTFEYDNTQLCKRDMNSEVHNWNDQGRPVWVYYPNTVLERNGGDIKYVIYFSFTSWDATRTDAEYLAENGFGIFNPDRKNACTLGESCGEAPTTPMWMQIQLQSFLAAGYAVLLTTMIGDDSYMYQETCKAPLKDENNIYNLCWNNGDNPDARYLSEVFTRIKEGNLLDGNPELIPSDPTLGTLDDRAVNFPKNPVNLDSYNCGLIGYSVGAQMVSRAINDFGNQTLNTVKNSPNVSVGCMISGGSLHCYEYCNADPLNGPRAAGKELCSLQPKSWGSCWNPETLGCCPAGLTEPRYDSVNDSVNESHPPVILVQTDFDYYADPRASENYYRALKDMNVDTEIIHGLCGNHNLFPAAIIPVLSFFTRHMSQTPYSTFV